MTTLLSLLAPLPLYAGLENSPISRIVMYVLATFGARYLIVSYINVSERIKRELAK